MCTYSTEIRREKAGIKARETGLEVCLFYIASI
jgi:hypothetical protein